jgi:hypothetical protein
MSAAQPSAVDSGHNHIVPLVVALVISAVTLAISLAVAGLPH